MTLAPETYFTHAAEMNAASVKLAGMETRAFALVRQGRQDAAVALLASEAHKEQKQLYTEGTEQVTAVLKAHVQANLDARRRLAFFAIAATGVVLPSLLFAWLGALRLVRRHVAARQQAQEELRLAKESAEEGRQLVEQLYRLAISMQTSWAREDRLRAFIQGAHEVAGFDRFYILLATPDGSRFELVATHGEEPPTSPRSLPPPVHSIRPSRPAVRWRCCKTRTCSRSSHWIRSIETILFRSQRFVIAPLVVGDRAVGAVCVDNKTSRRPISPASIEPFTLLCQQFARPWRRRAYTPRPTPGSERPPSSTSHRTAGVQPGHGPGPGSHYHEGGRAAGL